MGFYANLLLLFMKKYANLLLVITAKYRNIEYFDVWYTAN